MAAQDCRGKGRRVDRVGASRLPVVPHHHVPTNLLTQTEVLSTGIGEAVSFFGENNHFFDASELFEGGIDLRLHAGIRPDARRVNAATEFERRRPWLRNRTLLIQRQGKVWPSNWQRCRAV